MLSKYQNIYFLGIGGIGMSSLAQYFVHEKKNVGGYDKVESKITQNLEEINVAINYEDNVTNIPVEFFDRDKTLVIFTPAIPKLNKQFVHFKLNNFKILKRSCSNVKLICKFDKLTFITWELLKFRTRL